MESLNAYIESRYSLVSLNLSNIGITDSPGVLADKNYFFIYCACFQW